MKKTTKTKLFDNLRDEHRKDPSYIAKLPWLTVEQAALLLNTSPGGVRNRIYRGDIKARRPFGKGGRVFLAREDLDKIMRRT